MQKVEVVAIVQSDLEAYKQIQLESHKAEPYAFDTSHKEIAAWDEAKWLEKFNEHTDPEKCISLFVLVEKHIAGFALVYFNPKIKKRHIADFDTLYIKSEYRSKNLATTLVKHIINTLKSKHTHIIKISLCVYESQDAAIKLYKKLGFKVCGKYKKGLFVDGKYFDQVEMDLFLR